MDITDNKENMTEAPVLLSVRGLVKSFDGKTVLDGIDLDVRQGEVVVIVGPSGCGKSTLLRCINALEPIQGGEVLLDGQKIEKDGKNLTAIRQKIGMVFQSYDLFPHLTVLDNITLAPQKVQKRPRREAEEEAISLLKRVLFDEVTAALDPEMVREVLDVILQLARQGRTMLIVTHEMQFARAIADRVIFLDEGHVLEDLPPERFFTEPGTERAKNFLHMFEFEAVR